MKISNIRKHICTITHHKNLVRKGCFKVGLYRQGLLHDMSKYTPTEFIVGCKYYQGNRSPNNAEREDTGLSTSWIHHYGRNKHHFEHWVDYGINCDTIIQGVPMPRKYIAEMVMDRICASKVYNPGTYTDKAPLAYFMKSKEKLWFVHKQTNEHLEFLLRMLAEKGEKETLYYIRNVYLKGKEIKN